MITMQMEGTDIVSKSLRNIGLSMRDKKVLIKDVIRPAAKVVNGVRCKAKHQFCKMVQHLMFIARENFTQK
jgi:hypothetical protein